MAKSSKIEPADLTLYQEHMEKAAKVGLRRLRRLDVFDVSLSLAQAFATAQDDERRRLIMSTRLCLLNEQLQKLSAMEPPSEPKPKKAKKVEPEIELPLEPVAPPPPAPPKKEATLNMMDLGNAAMLLMAAEEPEEETPQDEAPEEEDHMAFLTASDYDPADTPNETEDHMAFLTASDDSNETDTGHNKDIM
jgi:hypothetical protein